MADLDKKSQLENIKHLTHSPENGFIDIKPINIQFSSKKELVSYSLGAVAIALFIYLLYETITKSLKRKANTQLSAKETFYKNLEITNNSSLPFRDFCESLAHALKVLVSSRVDYDLRSYTPLHFKKYMHKYLLQKFKNNTEHRLKEISETTANLLNDLEGGEYGDNLVLDQLSDKRDSLRNRSKEIGELILKL